ncbi:MAG: hypothetical protein KDI37_13730 [Xanthomonadales bacterium]|nr:hypothetical protein [Xanthomonadales bacterium]MCB1628380.1 hypothetical protein [Xanthomonadales bacterium]MCB1634179.1 hypothetical protein [Xanthomonadales bacterium]MCB1642788.1 hypothetical protein [Xanthomonadales bacterium]
MNRSIWIACLALGLPLTVQANEAEDIGHLQTRWAEVNYQLPEKDKVKAFEALAGEAEKLREAHPGMPSYLIWEGIIRSTYAGAKGGMGALGEVKKAKVLFEQAIAIEPGAMSGSALTSLGSLYYQVPGWPIGFGDDDEALKLLQQGLSYNPDGIDSNYFYADYLLEEKKYREAKVAFEKALAAPARPGRESADAGRRQEINAKLAIVQRKL